MRPQEFIDQIAPAAIACMKATGIPASFTLAQAALESSWGASKLALEGHNLFGVKADRSWTGDILMMETREVFNGKSVMVNARWRKYPTWQACIDDRAHFFADNPRYKDCFHETTGEGWAYAAKRAGYATDPAYAEKLIAVMRGRSMSRFDVVKP